MRARMYVYWRLGEGGGGGRCFMTNFVYVNYYYCVLNDGCCM